MLLTFAAVLDRKGGFYSLCFKRNGDRNERRGVSEARLDHRCNGVCSAGYYCFGVISAEQNTSVKKEQMRMDT